LAVKEHSSPRRFSWSLAFTIVGVAALAAGVFVFERCATLPGRAASGTVAQMERVGRDLRDTFVDLAHLQPRVTINDRVYFEQSSPTAELALISQRLEVEHDFLHTWAGSTKRLRLHGTYTAKAGFDLRQKWEVKVGDQTAAVELPHAQLLGVEQERIDVLALENGFWNPVSGADVQAQIATLHELARARAGERHLPEEAEQMLRTQLQSHLPPGQSVRFEFYSPRKVE